jgi:hypothetical protein
MSEQKQTKYPYLLAQKVVKLMSESHLEAFKRYLKDINAIMPLKMVSAIKPGFDDPTSSDELCGLIYNDNDTQTKKKFNQLSSYTYKLSAFVSRNFPYYLYAKVSELDTLLYEGRLFEANSLADALLDISERIGDYKTQANVLMFMAQQANLQKSYSEAKQLHEKIKIVLSYEDTINEIYLYAITHFNISVKDDSVLKSLDTHLNYYKKFFHHECETVSILSRFAYCFVINYYRPTEFLTEKHAELLNSLIADLTKNQTLTMPILEDLYSKTIYFKLNNSKIDLNSQEGKSFYVSLLVHNKHLYYWQNFVNKPELYAIAIKSTYYLSKYHAINHRDDFRDIIPREDLKDIQSMIERCEHLLKQKNWEPNNINDLIHLKLTYSALLMLGDEDQILLGIDTLETLMILYQQLTFSESVDSIFICLTVGYFAKSKYEKCVQTYKRFQKVSKGRVSNSENVFELNTYYFVSQWLLTKRPQYLRKLQENYQQASSHQNALTIQRTILEMVNYFEIPLSL